MNRPRPDGRDSGEWRKGGMLQHGPGRSSVSRIVRNEAGFSLAELVLVIVLLGIVSAMVAVPLMEGARIFTSAEVRADLTGQGRLAVERMAREIRMVRSRTAADLPGCCNNATLSFNDTSGNNIVYTVAGGNTITRNGVPLAAGDAASLNFSYFQQNGTTAAVNATQVWTIEVNLTVTKSGESQSYRVRVHPRN